MTDASASPRTAVVVVVVVVEDEPGLRHARSLLLDLEDYEVVTPCDGLQALQTRRLVRCDLVLTDRMMPRMDGLTLLRALREDATAAYPGNPHESDAAQRGDRAAVRGRVRRQAVRDLDAADDDAAASRRAARLTVARCGQAVPRDALQTGLSPFRAQATLSASCDRPAR